MSMFSDRDESEGFTREEWLARRTDVEKQCDADSKICDELYREMPLTMRYRDYEDQRKILNSFKSC